MNGLTQEQAYFAMQQVSRWLRIREQHEHDTVVPKRHFSQLVADVDHSALLLRLLQGGEPLPKPPPLRHGYPDYGTDEQTA